MISIIGDRPLLWIIGGDDKNKTSDGKRKPLADKEGAWSPKLRESFGRELYETAQKLKGYIVTDGTNSVCIQQIIEIVKKYDQMYANKVDLIAIAKVDTYRRRSDELIKYYRNWINIFN